MGRPRKPGRVFYLGRVRFNPAQDPPALKALLERIEAAPAGQKQPLIKAALIGGADQVPAGAAPGEAGETEKLLAGLFEGE